MPLVSIIVPTFNSSRWVCEAVDSALAQTYPNVEVIVVDDGSTDDTGDLLKKRYGERIRYYRQENQGPSAARNAGIHLSKGSYLSFLDADDAILSEKVAAQVSFLEAHPEFGVSYCDYSLFGNLEAGYMVESADTAHPSDPQAFIDLLLQGNLMVCHAPLIRRECFEVAGYFEEKLSFCEDWDMWLRIAGAGFLFSHLKLPLALYRQHHLGMSANRLNMSKGALEVTERASDYIRPLSPRRRKLLYALLGERHFRYGLELIKSNRTLQGLAHVFRSLNRRGFTPRKERIRYALQALFRKSNPQGDAAAS